jgi:hypothetical protein
MPLAKIIGWTSEPKSGDVRRASQAAISALFALNGPHFTGVLHKLPKIYQVSAARFVSIQYMCQNRKNISNDHKIYQIHRYKIFQITVK